MDVSCWLEMRETGYQSAIKFLDDNQITPESLGV
jgi:hypothetical protein